SAQLGLRVGGALSVERHPWQRRWNDDLERLCAALNSSVLTARCANIPSNGTATALRLELGPEAQTTNTALGDALLTSSGSERRVRPLTARADLGANLESSLRGLVDDPEALETAWKQLAGNTVDLLPSVALNRAYTLDRPPRAWASSTPMANPMERRKAWNSKRTPRRR
ncbi:MAG: hypothetical protein HC933_20380, partial [Pleurocapsa sp. SU_196_0]|nr:hypothetical protein [Pleurocapsa sp. SU_196_0]